MVTNLTRTRAFACIKAVAGEMIAGNTHIIYSELADKIGMRNKTGQGLGPILDEAATMCRKHNLPDVTAVVVTAESVRSGEPFPSLNSFNNEGIWPLSGLHIDDVPAEQKRVRDFDWQSLPTLNLNT